MQPISVQSNPLNGSDFRGGSGGTSQILNWIEPLTDRFLLCSTIEWDQSNIEPISELNHYRAGLPISRKVLQIMFWEVPPADWLICSYLLPRQALATHVEKHNKTLRLIDSPALYVSGDPLSSGLDCTAVPARSPCCVCAPVWPCGGTLAGRRPRQTRYRCGRRHLQICYCWRKQDTWSSSEQLYDIHPVFL